MIELEISSDTSGFEVPAALDGQGKLTLSCQQQALAMLDRYGLVIVTDLLAPEEADAGLGLIRETIEDPGRKQCAFASETDNRFKRRDFCSLPATAGVTGLAATLCQRLEGVLSAYCGRAHPLLEVTTLTSYFGSSHQYIHRDPSGVISLFAAVEDVSEEQGGTVFVPGTHLAGSHDNPHDQDSLAFMELFRTRCNLRILRYNLAKLSAMRSGKAFPLAPGEFRDRVFSSKWDEHQPNLMRFALGKNSQFSIRDLRPDVLWKLYRQREALGGRYRVVKSAPRKGTVILYQSDLLHAGPDNCSPIPRHIFSMSLARDMIETKSWHTGYSPHPTLAACPMSFGDLLDYPGTAAALSAPSSVDDRETAPAG